MEMKKFDCDVLSTGFLDESGDSGKKGTKCLVLTYICTKDGKKIDKILKKTKEQLRRTKKGERWLNRLGGEIKFNSFPDKHILIKTLENLSKLKLKVRFITIYKGDHNITDGERGQILLDLLVESFRTHDCMPKKIIADKDYFMNKKIAYLIVRNYEEVSYENKKEKGFRCKVSLLEEEQKPSDEEYNLVISIKHENSKIHPELQAVDLISGAIFQEMEKQDKTYTEIIRKNSEIMGRINKPKEK